MRVRSVILAAGQGKRMHSAIAKVLHPLLGKPMLHYALESVKPSTISQPVVVIGHGGDEIRQVFADEAEFVYQDPQLGTGHAVLQGKSLLEGQADMIVVTYGDMPLLTSQSISQIVELQKRHSGPFSMLTMTSDDPRGFGRVVRASSGEVAAIVEEAQATTDQLAIKELNPGVYCFSADWLWEALDRVPLSPNGEYYLTDLVQIAVDSNLSVQALPLHDDREGIGVNTRQHLAEAGAVLRERINRDWMLSGVTLIDPMRTYIEPDVQIGQDTVLWPDTYLFSGTRIGSSSILGPDTMIRNSQVGDRCKIECSILEGSLVENEVHIGPYAHIRNKTHLASNVHIGNFGEVKSSFLGKGTKMGHFSYIGDAEIGQNVNIGAGTITCNFDGEKKNKTEIGAGVFIGSDTMLVAPITLGDGSRTGAGSVVTKDVPAYTLAVGVPARSIRKIEKRE